MEAIRFTHTSERLPPPSENIENFTLRYANSLRTPIYLWNHVDKLRHESDEIMIAERTSAMIEYLNDYINPKDEKMEYFYWGRTLVAEVALADKTRATFKPVLEREGLEVVLAPTSMDITNKKVGDDYAKGVDYIFKQGDKGICGTDVTINVNKLIIGAEDVAPNKHSRPGKYQKPGLRADCDMPATVELYRDLTYTEQSTGNKKGYINYLDDVVRQEIVETGTYTPFANLTEADTYVWKMAIIRKKLESIPICRYTFRLPRYESVGKHTNMALINKRLDYMRDLSVEIYNGLLQQLPDSIDNRTKRLSLRERF